MRTLSIVFALVFSALSFSASAARYQSYNEVVFDAAGNVIGQKMEYCNDTRWAGGASNGAYKLLVYGVCSASAVGCEAVVENNYACFNSYPATHAIEAVVIGGSGSATVTDLCALAGVCGSWEPQFVSQGNFIMVRTK